MYPGVWRALCALYPVAAADCIPYGLLFTWSFPFPSECCYCRFPWHLQSQHIGACPFKTKCGDCRTLSPGMGDLEGYPMDLDMWHTKILLNLNSNQTWFISPHHNICPLAQNGLNEISYTRCVRKVLGDHVRWRSSPE